MSNASAARVGFSGPVAEWTSSFIARPYASSGPAVNPGWPPDAPMGAVLGGLTVAGAYLTTEPHRAERRAHGAVALRDHRHSSDTGAAFLQPRDARVSLERRAEQTAWHWRREQRSSTRTKVNAHASTIPARGDKHAIAVQPSGPAWPPWGTCGGITTQSPACVTRVSSPTVKVNSPLVTIAICCSEWWCMSATALGSKVTKFVITESVVIGWKAMPGTRWSAGRWLKFASGRPRRRLRRIDEVCHGQRKRT